MEEKAASPRTRSEWNGRHASSYAARGFRHLTPAIANHPSRVMDVPLEGDRCPWSAYMRCVCMEYSTSDPRVPV